MLNDGRFLLMVCTQIDPEPYILKEIPKTETQLENNRLKPIPELQMLNNNIFLSMRVY